MKTKVILLTLALLSLTCISGSNFKKVSSNGAIYPGSYNYENRATGIVAEYDNLSRKEFSDKLDGYWHLVKYFDLIENAKSVWAAARATGDVISCGFMKESLMGDNPLAEGASAHEGGFIVELEWDASANTFRTKEGGHNFLTEKPFYINILTGNEIALIFDDGGMKKFRKTDMGREINDILFTGKYIMSDGSSIRFTSDGKITGHPIFKGYDYSVVTDFFEFRMDAIRLVDPQGSYSFYHYVFNDDGFDLYNIEGNMPTGYSKGYLFDSFVFAGGKNTRTNPGTYVTSIKTHYYDLPAQSTRDLENILKTNDLTTLGGKSLNIMGDYLKRTVLAGISQFGPYIDSNYFWYIYNALPGFVAKEERHQGYYKDQNDQSMQERLLAYAIYRIDRSPGNIEKLFRYAKPFLKEVITPESYARQGISRKVNGLLESYEIIGQIDDYHLKLSDAYTAVDTMTGTFLDYGSHKEFRKFENSAYGFPVYELERKVMEYLDPHTHRFHYMPAGLSFWMRRNHEGNMEEVYAILQEIRKMYQ